MRQGRGADAGASGFECSAPCVDLHRYAAWFSPSLWVRTRLKRIAGRILRLPFFDSARPQSAVVGGLPWGGADTPWHTVFRVIFFISAKSSKGDDAKLQGLKWQPAAQFPIWKPLQLAAFLFSSSACRFYLPCLAGERSVISIGQMTDGEGSR